MDKNIQGRLLKHINAVFIIFLMVLLSSCYKTTKKDGAPNFYVDETKVPNAVPKVEPLARAGNKPYTVFGKRYYPMQSSRNYEAVGVASWYGTQFHSRDTSSGERYDMLGMTAAHKTLPLPTYVEVTNLKNNRKVIVKVNDHGPFEGNRLIDLSYVAAKKLGMLGHGTALVKIRAINPSNYHNPNLTYIASNKPTKTNTKLASTSSYKSSWQPSKSKSIAKQTQLVYLQVGAFRHKSHAEKLKQHLATTLHMPVKISNPSAKGSKLYRVKIGPIKDVATANKITHRLKNLGISSNKIYEA